MRVLLINPPWTFYPGTNRRLGGPPSTLATVAAAFRSRGHEVVLLDMMATDHYVDTGEIRQSGYDLSYATWMAGDPFDAIGISSTWTVQHSNAVAVARAIRAVSNCPIFAGGHHISVTKQIDEFDFIVTGEVESAIESIEQTITGANQNGVISGVPVDNLDSLSFPAYELLPLDYYRSAQRNHHGSSLLGGMPVVTSRGCPHRCNFCTVHLSMGRKWRSNSPDYVLAHLQYLASLGFVRFHFEDDNLTLDRERWMSVMEGMASAGVYSWDTPNGIRLDSLDTEMLELASRSGCAEVRVSVESANDRIRNKIVGKQLSIDNMVSTAVKCRDLGIRLSCFYVCGIPGETIEDMRSTLRLATDLEANYGVIPRYSTATPFPGTDLLKECKANGWLDRAYTLDSLAAATHLRGLIRTPEFTPDDINQVYAEWKAGRL